MNFLAYCLVILAATVYVAESQSLIETLVTRAEALIHRARADIERLHGEGKAHVVHEIEREIRNVEQSIRTLRSLPHDWKLEEHQIHQIEEQLLHHENVLAEEIRKVEAHSDVGPHDLHALIARAHELEQRAKTDLARLYEEGYATKTTRHLVAEIEHQVRAIEELLHELRIHPQSTLEGEHGVQFERRLAEHERILAAELRRLEGQALF